MQEKCSRTPILKILSTAVLFMAVLTVNAQEKKLSVDVKGVSFDAVAWYLQKNSDCIIYYENDDIGKITNLNISVKDKSVSQILDLCLSGTNLYYEKNGNIYTIKKKIPDRNIYVSGIIKDETGEVLPGTTIQLKGSKNGAISGMDGRYSLLIPDKKGIILTFSFIGMEPQEVAYNGNKEINVTLKTSANSMEEVVVTGYQNIKRKDLVGSYTTLKADDIIMPAYSSIDQMLQGRVAGMVVTNTSTRVGTAPKIQIRGTSTLMGNQDPLWVVDGIIQEDPIELETTSLMTDDLKNIIGNQISWLNPQDIETITVLKDASATAIYGSKASNGVIEITTKKGKMDKLTINYTANFSVTNRPHYDDLNYMNSQERIQFSEDAFNWGTAYSSVPIKQPYTYEGLMRMYLENDISQQEFLRQRAALETQNTDWLGLLTRNAFSHSHNLSVRGGTKKIFYNTSVSYSKSAGQEIGNDSERMTGRINLDFTPNDKISINVSINGSVGKNTGFGQNVSPLQYATTANRTIPAYDSEGNLAFYQKRATYVLNNTVTSLGYNILNEMNNSGSSSKSSDLSASLDFKWRILDWLTYQFTGGYGNSNSDNQSYGTERTFSIAENYRGYDYNSVLPNSPEFKAAMLPFGGELFTNNARQTSYNIQNKLLVSKSFGRAGRLNALIGMEVRSATNNSISNTVYGYVPDRGEKLVQPTPLDDLIPISGKVDEAWGILQKIYEGQWQKINQTNNFFSVFATFAYSFLDRYVINANIRNDASNRFGQDANRRIDPTYSFGFSWRASEESFMKDYIPWISILNFRGTYGIQGNALTRLSPDLILTQGTIAYLYNQYQSGISQIPNPNLTWERTTSWNIGMDLELFQMVNMNLEYYSRRSNAIVAQSLPYEYGVSEMNMNGGIITNQGIEYTVSFTPVRTRDFALSVSINASKNWNSTGKTDYEPLTADFLNGRTDVIIKEGYPIGGFWSYSFAGLDGKTGLPTFNLLDVPEEKRSRTLDPTTYLVYSGQRDPFFTGGLNLSLRYKSLTLSTSFSLLLGGKKRLASPYEQFGNRYFMPEPDVNVNRDLLDRWQKPGDELHTIIPSLPGQNQVYIALPNGETEYPIYVWEDSDAMVVNASFLRCQQIGLSWNINPGKLEKVGVSNLLLSANVNNIFVIASKRFNGFDPEVQNSIMPRTFSLGINIGF